MAESDLFDDDAFFTNLDLAVLDQVEAQAISSTQAVKETDNRHHTIPPPQKEPRPINTEPRAGGKSTFGFGELGKHTHPANETRYIDGVEQRKQYWGLKCDDDLDYPAVTVDATGRYGLAQDSDDDEMVVDLHAPGGRALAFGRQRALQPDPNSQGARARREALVRPGPMLPPAPPTRDDGSAKILPGSQNRVLSRSVSTGKQVIIPRTGRAQSNLAPIASQASQPSSQGSQVRRSALQLDDERRKREELEEQVRSLQVQLRESKRPQEHWTDGVHVELNGEPIEQQIKAIQAQLWQAKGEAETVRRTHKTDAGKHQDETDKLKNRIAELERAIVEKEKENAARVESVKSQAIFATHAAFNSATTGRTRRTTQADTKTLGSPSRRQQQEKVATKKVEPVTHNPPSKFGGLNNGFASSPKIRRTAPADQSPVPDLHREATPEIAPEFQVEYASASEDNSPAWSERSQLVHHLLNYAGTSRDTQDTWTEPLSYRLLRLETTSEGYHECCARLLRACSDAELDPHQTSETILETLAKILSRLSRATIKHEGSDQKTIGALSNVLDLLASTLFRFPAYFTNASTNLVEHVKALALHFYATGPGTKGEQLSPTVKLLLGQQLVQLCEALCWLSGVKAWDGDDLVVIIYLLSDPKHDHRLVARSLDLLHAASCCSDNFRALVAASENVRADDHRKSRLDLPLIERFSRYLQTPHPGCTTHEMRQMNMTIVQSIGMMSLANPDAPVLLSERSSLVPGLILLLNREATGLLGVSAEPAAKQEILLTLSFALSILHHLVYPSPLLLRPAIPLSQARQDPFVSHSHVDPETTVHPPQGIDLQARLLTASSLKEFSGLQHMFVSALGSMAYCEPIGMSPKREDDIALGDSSTLAPALERVSVDWRSIQYLSQDLLEAVVEGPEADEIYEMYFSGDLKAHPLEKKDVMEVDEGDEEGYAAMREDVVMEV